ncbi:MAG: DegT/DnrJ/EryC1/StrS family aminotransferase [Candidatus Tumulicola sp.]
MDSPDRTIPLIDLQPQHQEIAAEAQRAIASVVESAAFINGPDVAAFEGEFAEYVSTQFCIGVGSGTAALKLSMQALDIGPGDEVIVPANTFIACAFAVSQLGARPIFVDMDEHYTIDADRVEEAISPRTKAVMAVHLYGNGADMARIGKIALKHRLKVIEDVSQAHGARLNGKRLGSFGDVAAFSFYPGKNLGAFGDAGAVCTNDAGIDRKIRLLRDLGQVRRHEHVVVGDNSRLDSLQAAILRIKLRHLDSWNAERRSAAQRYDALLCESGFKPPPRRNGCEHVYQYYVVNVCDRKRVLGQLSDRGIKAAIHHPVPIHLQPAYRHLGIARGRFPRSEETCETVLSLPIFPGITNAQVDRVASVLRDHAKPAYHVWA